MSKARNEKRYNEIRAELNGYKDYEVYFVIGEKNSGRYDYYDDYSEALAREGSLHESYDEDGSLNFVQIRYSSADIQTIRVSEILGYLPQTPWDYLYYGTYHSSSPDGSAVMELLSELQNLFMGRDHAEATDRPTKAGLDV